jgi:hypothetical protein
MQSETIENIDEYRPNWGTYNLAMFGAYRRVGALD